MADTGMSDTTERERLAERVRQWLEDYRNDRNSLLEDGQTAMEVMEDVAALLEAQPEHCPVCDHDAAYHCTRCGETWYGAQPVEAQREAEPDPSPESEGDLREAFMAGAGYASADSSVRHRASREHAFQHWLSTRTQP